MSSPAGAGVTSARTDVILKITTRDFQLKRTLLLYRFLQLILLPFISLYFLARLVRSRSYWAHFHERCGFLPRSFNRTKTGAIWLHAVSVGEVSSVIPLIRKLKTDQPRIPVYLSTSTVAGRNAAKRLAGEFIDGVFYSPIDYVFCVRRVLRAIRPALVVIIETEIWPNLYAETKRFGARLAIVNGRISDRAWLRYRRWARWLRPVLQTPDLILVQSEGDYERYAELGAERKCTEIAPNLKYEASLKAEPLSIDTFGAQHVWIAASTVGPNERGSLKKHLIDEDDIVLDTFQDVAREFRSLLLILAPRQPVRFDVVADKLRSRGLSFLRRSETRARTDVRLPLPGVLLLDTMGELSGLYGLANVAFVGGSIAPRGGHNILEPAAAGTPIIVGPHMENFESIAREFAAADALVQIESSEELGRVIRDLLNDQDKRVQIGERARRLVESKRGGAAELAGRLWLLYFAASIRNTRNTLARLALAPLAGLWSEGGTLKRKRSEHFTLIAPPLSAPVISVGGITVGGSGKTPFAVYLVNRLKARGHSPAILTRGYRRRTPLEALVVAAGAKVPTAVTGDEAQIFLRAADAPVGIGANRYGTAQTLLRQFPETDVLVLDDGFQHARLMRDFDIVMIDGLDPFGGEEVVPLGRLREPLDALARADVFVISRAENDFRYEAIRRRLRDCNAKAQTFRSRLVARSWHDYATGAILPSLAGRRAAAFCGLGNPESFWRTLETLGLEVVFRWAFPDHHAYNPIELQRVAHQARMHGAEILVTTEKDRINCPKHLEKSIGPLQLAWLKIEFELDDEAGFFEMLDQVLRTWGEQHNKPATGELVKRRR